MFQRCSIDKRVPTNCFNGAGLTTNVFKQNCIDERVSTQRFQANVTKPFQPKCIDERGTTKLSLPWDVIRLSPSSLIESGPDTQTKIFRSGWVAMGLFVNRLTSKHVNQQSLMRIVGNVTSTHDAS